MPVVLNVAEKPSVAREVSRILNNGSLPPSQMLHGCALRRAGCAAAACVARCRRGASRVAVRATETANPTHGAARCPAPPARRSARYNPVYSFGCTIQSQQCQMRFTSITGAQRTQQGPLRRAGALARPPCAPLTRAPLRAGHLLESDFGPGWKGWRSCAEGDLIDPQVSRLVTGVRRDCESQETLLKAEARGADWLILWLDCDREGEAICHEARAPALALLSRKRSFRALTP